MALSVLMTAASTLSAVVSSIFPVFNLFRVALFSPISHCLSKKLAGIIIRNTAYFLNLLVFLLQVMTPFLTAKLAGQFVAVDAAGLFMSTLQVIFLFPILSTDFYFLPGI